MVVLHMPCLLLPNVKAVFEEALQLIKDSEVSINKGNADCCSVIYCRHTSFKELEQFLYHNAS